MAGGKALKSEVLSTSACSLCGICLGWCPYIKSIEDRIAMPFDCNVEEGLCHAACPRTRTDWAVIEEQFLGGVPATIEVGRLQAVHRARRRSPAPGQQDGGTVTALVEAALGRDGLAEAALLTASGNGDGITPVAVLCETPEDAVRAAGSRFVAAPSLAKLAEAAARGLKRLVVVGRPCQVQAVRKLQAARPEVFAPDDLTVIGLFCLWSLSWKLRGVVEQELEGATLRRLTIPIHGMEAETDQGVRRIDPQRVKELQEPGCAYCFDMTSELADVSVGALEIEPGSNTVLVRSSRGADLIERALAGGRLEIGDYPEAELVRLKKASLGKKARALAALSERFASGEMPAFLDLDAQPYREILARDGGSAAAPESP